MWSDSQQLKNLPAHKRSQTKWRHIYLTVNSVVVYHTKSPNSQIPTKPIQQFCRYLPGLTEKAMATHSSSLAWKIPRTEEPGGLQSTGSRRVRHHWATSLSLFTFMHWRRKWQPNPVFLPGEPQDGGAWWAAVYGVTQSRTRLTWLSSSSM